MNKDLSPDLNNGITRAIFISWGTTPELRDKLIIYVNGAQIKLKDSLTTFIEILSYPGAVPDRKLLQISVTSCSDADWRKNELIKPPFRKERWDLSDAGIDLAKLGPIFVKYWQKRFPIWVRLSISCSLDLKTEGNWHLFSSR